MELNWNFVLTGAPDPSELDSEQTRHAMAWRSETRKNRAAARAERKHRVPSAIPTPSRPEALV